MVLFQVAGIFTLCRMPRYRQTSDKGQCTETQRKRDEAGARKVGEKVVLFSDGHSVGPAYPRTLCFMPRQAEAKSTASPIASRSFCNFICSQGRECCCAHTKRTTL